jgi:hypothetical protein
LFYYNVYKYLQLPYHSQDNTHRIFYRRAFIIPYFTNMNTLIHYPIINLLKVLFTLVIIMHQVDIIFE